MADRTGRALPRASSRGGERQTSKQPGWQSVGSLGSGGRPVNLKTALWPRLGRMLLPPRCLVCDAVGADTRDLCRACADDLPWLGPACARCALPLPLAAPACGACLVAPPP